MEGFVIATTHKDAKAPGGKRTRIWVVVALDERDALRILGMRGTRVVQKGPEALAIVRRNGIEDGGYRQLTGTAGRGGVGER